MERYTGSVCRLCRREGTKLFLKGERCYSDKCAMVKRPTPPGEHGQSRRKVTDYGTQLREKQKVRRAYGMLEKQFHHYYELAEHEAGVTGENMLSLLETRLDNVIYRLGYGVSRAQARQWVLHGHFQVNGVKVNIPSYIVKPGDEITVREKSRSMERMKALREGADTNIPKWLSFDAENLKGTVVAKPQRDDIDLTIAEHLIVEYYSR